MSRAVSRHDFKSPTGFAINEKWKCRDRNLCLQFIELGQWHSIALKFCSSRTLLVKKNPFFFASLVPAFTVILWSRARVEQGWGWTCSCMFQGRDRGFVSIPRLFGSAVICSHRQRVIHRVGTLLFRLVLWWHPCYRRCWGSGFSAQPLHFSLTKLLSDQPLCPVNHWIRSTVVSNRSLAPPNLCLVNHCIRSTIGSSQPLRLVNHCVRSTIVSDSPLCLVNH